MKKLIIFSVLYFLIYSGLSIAASNTSAGHEMTDHDTMDKTMEKKITKPATLSTLATVPSSGKSREPGFDDRYAMEPTSVQAGFDEKCALASRGIIILDRANMKKCGIQSGSVTKKIDHPRRKKTDRSQH